MAPLLENHLKELLGRHGIRVPAGCVITQAGVAQAAAVLAGAGLGVPAVVKALIPAGKKQKAGAVFFADTAAGAISHVKSLLGQTILGHHVGAVLVEERVAVVRELFVSFNFDGLRGGPVLLLSSAGGIDVEEAASRHPDRFVQIPIDVLQGLHPRLVRSAWRQLGLSGRAAAAATRAVLGLCEVFRKSDARLLEVNPLGLTPAGHVVALGALLDVDDEALYRQPELAAWVEYGSGRYGRPLTPLERRLFDLSRQEGSGSVRFMEFPGGDLGCLLFGGGCSLLSADIIREAGGRPATYYDGTAPGEKVETVLFEGVLQIPGLRGLIFGANLLSQRPVVGRLRPLVEVLRRLRTPLAHLPVVVRLAGKGEDEARALAATLPGLHYFGGEVTLEEAIAFFLEQVGRSPKEACAAS